MAVVSIPIATGVPSFRQRTTLDGREYILVFRWSQREERWYLDLLDAQENLLAGAIKVVANWPLLESRRFAAGMPPGEIIALDRRASAEDPGLAELGSLVPLLYIPIADVPTFFPSSSSGGAGAIAGAVLGGGIGRDGI